MKARFQDCDLPKAADKQAGRFTGIQFIQVDIEGKRAIATNGKILAVVPIEPEEGDVSGMIPTEAWAMAAKQAKAKKHEAAANEVSIQANGKVTVKDLVANLEQSWARPEGTFPQWEKVIPAPQENDRIVTLNIDALVELSKAVGTNLEATWKYGKGRFLTLRIPEASNLPVHVEGLKPANDTGAQRPWGLIMPVVLE